MDENVVDTLKIEITADTSDATDGVEKLVATLEKIKSTAVGSNKGFSSMQTMLSKIADAVSKISESSTARLKELADGLTELNAVGKIQFGKTADKILDLGAAIEGLKDVDFSKLTELTNGLQALKGATGVVIPEMKSPSNATGTIPTQSASPALKLDASPAVDNLKDVIEVTDGAAKGLQEIAKVTATPVNVDDFIKGTSELDVLQMKLTATKNKLSELLQSGDDADTSGIANLLSTINQLEGKIAKVTATTNSFEEQLKRLSERVKEKFRSIGDSVSKAFSSLVERSSGSISRLTKKISNLFIIFQKRALYRAINAVISAITTGFREGTANVYQYSKALGGRLAASLDSIATSCLYLTNSFGAMVAPLINMVAPAIDYVIDKFVDLLNIINQVFAKMSGASTWTKAIKYPTEYAEAADNAAAANKKLKMTILDIDEINPMQDNSSRSGSSSADGLDYSKMFEEVELESGRIGNALSDFFKPFADAWANEGQNTIGAISLAFDGIKTWCTSVGDSFREIWTNGTGQQSLETILRIFQNILNCVGNLSTSLSTAWDANNNGTMILQNIWDIFNDILSLIERIGGATAEWLRTLDFTPLMTAIQGCTAVLEPFVSLICDALLWAYQTVLLPLASWVIEDAAPVSIEAVTQALQALHAFLEPFLDGFKSLWESLQPIVKWVGERVTTVIHNVGSLFEKLAAVFEEKGPEIQNIVSGIGDIISAVWKLVSPIFTVSVKQVDLTFGIIGEIISFGVGHAIDLLSSLIDFVAGVFTGDWGRAWDGIKGIVDSVWSPIKTVINDILGAVETMANGVVKGLNTMIKALNKVSFDIPSWVPGIGGSSFGLNIKEISEVSIPRLADGGMVNAGTAFIAGEAGAEVIANIGNRTGVMNTDEMRESVAEGVADANAEQNALLREQNNLLRKLLEKDNTYASYVGTGSLISGLERKNRRDGRTIVPVGV